MSHASKLCKRKDGYLKVQGAHIKLLKMGTCWLVTIIHGQFHWVQLVAREKKHRNRLRCTSIYLDIHLSSHSDSKNQLPTSHQGVGGAMTNKDLLLRWAQNRKQCVLQEDWTSEQKPHTWTAKKSTVFPQHKCTSWHGLHMQSTISCFIPNYKLW